jgi:subtilisin
MRSAWRFAVPAAVLAAGLSAQTHSLPTPERWIVMFKQRSFDLEAYRAAVRAQAPAAVDEAVATLEARMRADQHAFVQLVESLGGRVTHQWWLVNGLAVEIDAGQLGALQAHDNVAQILRDQQRFAGIKTSTNAQNHASDALTASGIKGRGVTVAIVDSGIDENMNGTGRPHATFYVNGNVNDRTGGGIQGSRVLVNRQIGMMPADDIISHGTPVAGVAAGERWNQGTRADHGHAPLASIASYCVADDQAGGTWFTTLVNAWQAVAADRVRYNVSVANCAYQGLWSPLAPDQQALDALAWNGDVLVTGMGGNDPTSSLFGYGSTNMLAVGATEADTRLVASFSTPGPLLNSRRFYPDLVANGVGIVAPMADNEAGDKTGSGTSYACAQVAGAATLYRSLRPTATAPEVKAALLVSCEDVSGKNRTPPRNTRNHYGHGYLRIDRLAQVATGPSLVLTSTVTPVLPVTVRFAVQQGLSYAVAIAWFRKDVQQAAWSNLDLRVAMGTTTLIESTTPENLDEVTRFIAPATGLVDLRVTCVALESGLVNQPFALVASEVSPFFVHGGFTVAGIACPVGSEPRIAGGSVPPEIGRAYDVVLSARRAQQPFVLLAGVSDQQWSNLTLPLALDPIGAPGCWLSVSPDVQLLGMTDVAGFARTPIALPSDPALVNAMLFHQSAIADAQANQLGVVFSDYLKARIGGQR